MTAAAQTPPCSTNVTARPGDGSGSGTGRPCASTQPAPPRPRSGSRRYDDLDRLVAQGSGERLPERRPVLQRHHELGDRPACEPAAEDPDQEGHRHAREADDEQQREDLGRRVGHLVRDHDEADREQRRGSCGEDRCEQPAHGGSRGAPAPDEERQDDRDHAEAEDRGRQLDRARRGLAAPRSRWGCRASFAAARRRGRVEQQDQDRGQRQHGPDGHGDRALEPPS